MARDFVEQPVNLTEKVNLMASWIDAYHEPDDSRPFIINEALLDVRSFSAVRKVLEAANILDDDRVSSKELLRIVDAIFNPDLTEVVINSQQRDVGE